MQYKHGTRKALECLCGGSWRTRSAGGQGRWYTSESRLTSQHSLIQTRGSRCVILPALEEEEQEDEEEEGRGGKKRGEFKGSEMTGTRGASPQAGQVSPPVQQRRHQLAAELNQNTRSRRSAAFLKPLISILSVILKSLSWKSAESNPRLSGAPRIKNH